MNAGISIVSSLVQGDDIGTIIGNSLNAFGDGFAGGFMIGGIMAGTSMALSSGFRIAGKVSARTGRRGGGSFNHGSKGVSGSEIPKRPSWRQSEMDAQKAYPDYKPQKSFKNGQEVPYGTKGSTRPELYKTGHSIEVKNYKVETLSGQNNLVNNVSRQIQSRTLNLPRGTRQTVIVDVRGQTVSNEVLKSIRHRILEKSGIKIEIIFMR